MLTTQSVDNVTTQSLTTGTTYQEESTSVNVLSTGYTLDINFTALIESTTSFAIQDGASDPDVTAEEETSLWTKYTKQYTDTVNEVRKRKPGDGSLYKGPSLYVPRKNVFYHTDFAPGSGVTTPYIGIEQPPISPRKPTERGRCST